MSVKNDRKHAWPSWRLVKIDGESPELRTKIRVPLRGRYSVIRHVMILLYANKRCMLLEPRIRGPLGA